MINKIKNFFGFTKIPFSKLASTTELFQSKEIKEVQARLELALQNEDIFLLTGAVGSGKTTSIRYFLNNIDPAGYKAVYISVAKYKFGEIAKHALAELKIEVPYSTNIAIRKLKQTIISHHKDRNIKVILIIDEAQDLSIETLISLKNTVNFDMDSQNRMLLILSGQKEFLQILDFDSLSSLKRRIRLRYEMANLAIEETKTYINHQLKIVGFHRPLFPDDVISQIYASTKGNVSEINRVCLNMINTAVVEEKEIMELSILEKSIIF